MERPNVGPMVPVENVRVIYSGVMHKPQVLFTPRVWGMMQHLIHKYQNDEVCWYGTVIVEPDNRNDVYLVDNIFIPKQTNQAAYTEPSGADNNDFSQELVEAGRAEDAKRIRFWGHSHVNMAPHPSGKDDSTFTELIGRGWSFGIRAILNLRGELTVFFGEGSRCCTLWYPVEWGIDYAVGTEDIAWIDKECTDKVKMLRDQVAQRAPCGGSQLPKQQRFLTTRNAGARKPVCDFRCSACKVVGCTLREMVCRNGAVRAGGKAGKNDGGVGVPVSGVRA